MNILKAVIMTRVYALKVWKGRVSLADITERRGDILFRVSGEFIRL